MIAIARLKQHKMARNPTNSQIKWTAKISNWNPADIPRKAAINIIEIDSFMSFVFIFSFGGEYNISALNFFLFEDEGMNPQIIFIKNFLKDKRITPLSDK